MALFAQCAGLHLTLYNCIAFLPLQDDVGTWLRLLGLQIYEENFIDGGFDDMDFIKDLDFSDLEMIEIRKKGHQKKLLLAVQKLSDVELTADLDQVIQG